MRGYLRKPEANSRSCRSASSSSSDFMNVAGIASKMALTCGSKPISSIHVKKISFVTHLPNRDINHAVSLIEDNVVTLIEDDEAALEAVVESTRRGDDDLAALT